MPFQAQRPIRRAARNLQDDEGFVRWPVQVLFDFLNDGVKEIVRLKPNSVATQLTFNLAAGIRQTLPSQATMLIRAICNSSTQIPITMVRSLEDMDAILPSWRRGLVMPASAVVTHVIYDIAEPLNFHVVPSNTGAGSIQAICGVIPADMAVPANPTVIGSYTMDVPVPDIYQVALSDYITYRALVADATEVGAAERAASHRAMFEQAVMGVGQAEAAAGQQTQAATAR